MQIPEASLIVTDFTNSVNGSSMSSCNTLLFGLIQLLCLLFLFNGTPPKKNKKITRSKKRKLYDLLNTETVKSGTIRLASEKCWTMHQNLYKFRVYIFFKGYRYVLVIPPVLAAAS